MTTIKDVAKRAGVAISTVSKVLNGYSGISEETRTKVNRAIEELNFIPNSIAAALSSKKSGRIALLLHMSTQTKVIDEIEMQYLAGGIHKAQEQQLDLIVVFFSMLQEMNLEEIIQYFQVQNIDGIIIYGMTKDDILIQQITEVELFKIVFVDVPIIRKYISSVGVDQKRAQKEVACRTMEENHCNSLLYIAGKENSYAAQERLLGMLEVAQEKKWDMTVVNGAFSEMQARKLTFQYAEQKEAIVCSSDIMAIGAMRALIEMDIFRPVCGFDGLILMGYAGKQMNTIQQDFAGVSAKAVAEIQYLLEGGSGRRVITSHTIERMQYRDVIGMTKEEEIAEIEQLKNRKRGKSITKSESEGI